MIASRRRLGRSLVVGIQGGQGTGKTTLARTLASDLAEAGLRVVAFSLDDFYASAEERRALASSLPANPYYRIARGMPGTHRVGALGETLTRLAAGEDVNLPVFDKSAHGGYGDVAESVVPVRGRQDVVIFEGWCVGMPRASPEEVAAIARRHGLADPAAPAAREHLAQVLDRVEPYLALWTFIDVVVALRPETPQLIERWRLDQEHELIARTGRGLADDDVRELVRRFLPFTFLCDEQVRADVVVRLEPDHAGRVVTVRPERG